MGIIKIMAIVIGSFIMIVAMDNIMIREKLNLVEDITHIVADACIKNITECEEMTDVKIKEEFLIHKENIPIGIIDSSRMWLAGIR